MAKIDTAGQYESLRKEIESGNFKPVYILMGEEPFYPEKLCSLIMERALQPHERDFNQTVLYGADTSAEEIVSICERYPMMAERTLVVVREAQALKKPEGLGIYLDHISPTTVLVLLFSGKNMDKRTSFYKKATKSCVIFESAKIREEAMPRWIESWFRSIGRGIEPQGAMLLAEYAGNDLRKISIEADKLLKAVPESQKTITAADIEQNVGISREFNTGELTSALAVRDGDKAFRIAWFFGESPLLLQSGDDPCHNAPRQDIRQGRSFQSRSLLQLRRSLSVRCQELQPAAYHARHIMDQGVRLAQQKQLRRQCRGRRTSDGTYRKDTVSLKQSSSALRNVCR